MTSFQTARKILQKNQLEAILFSSRAHLTYLTNYGGFSPQERDAYILLLANKNYLFTSALYYHELKEYAKDFHIIENNSSHPFIKNISDVIKKNGLERIGFESDNITVTEYLRLTENISSRFISVDLNALRSCKTPEEISLIKKACTLADTALKKIKPKIKPGITEEQVALKFETAVRKMGGRLSFPTIVAFGTNASIPHHHTDKTKLKSKDIFLIDCGVEINNYCSDMTRTFFIGDPPSEQKKAYTVTRDAQKKAVDFIENNLSNNRPILASEVDAIAREYIISKGYPSIPHSLGHGIGIEVHEAPSISPTSKANVEDGMVFSIEPGIYVPDKLGIRIEDLYVIQNQKLTQLTPSASAL